MVTIIFVFRRGEKRGGGKSCSRSFMGASLRAAFSMEKKEEGEGEGVTCTVHYLPELEEKKGGKGRRARI